MKLELNTFSYIIVFNETLRVTHDTCRDMKRKLRYANMYKQEIITAIEKSCIINDPDLINYNYFPVTSSGANRKLNNWNMTFAYVRLPLT